MPTDSRAKIISAARRSFYERGFEHTSFADLAQLSGVPKGNFYYHFRSKEDLLAAVLEARRADVEAALAAWSEKLATPQKRLERFVQMLTNDSADLVAFGCPLGSMLTELGKKHEASHEQAVALLEVFVAWATAQLIEAGYGPKTARTLAVRLLSRCQGAIVVAHAYGDASLLAREVSDIEKWVAGVVAARAAPA